MSDEDKRRKALEALVAIDQELEAIKSYWPEDVEIEGLKLVCTCAACPEQYDVFNAAGTQIGYLRLRRGHFRADVPDVGGETVYEADTKGDGVFETEERILHLTAAVQKIKAWWERQLAK